MASQENSPAKQSAKVADDVVCQADSTLPPSRSKIDSTLRQILCDVLGLEGSDVDKFNNDTGMFGHIPELDSMAVAGLLTELEDRFDFIIDDEDVDGEMLETYGGLLAFAEGKAAEA